jgi:hypothetical protein
MAKLAVRAVGLLACPGLAACASTRDASDAGWPAASIGPGIEGYAGRWHGSMWETGGSLYQGSSTLEVVLAADGTWKGRVGAAPASGTARLAGDRLVVSGTTGPLGGPQLPIYVDLTGDAQRRWGEIAATFGGRRAPASVELRREAP